MTFRGKLLSLFSLLFILLHFVPVIGAENEDKPAFEVIVPATIIQYIPVDIEIKISEKDLEPDTLSLIMGGELLEVVKTDGAYSFSQAFDHNQDFFIEMDGYEFHKKVTPVPLWMSVIPPLIAILIALLFREVFIALFLGIWMGSVIVTYFQGYSLIVALFYGIFNIINVYIMNALVDYDHMSIIVFSLMIGGMVALISRNGGMKGVVNYLTRFAIGPKSGQFVTWLLGLAIFFDDYANTLIVGNTMRPVTDRLRISREKLSYLVDSTAAPVAALALTTTWIGVELAYIQEGINTIGLNESAYLIFVQSLSTRFYPILTLVFILILIYTGRDYGPMLKAERLIRQTNNPDEVNAIHPKVAQSDDDYAKPRWYNAAIPVLIVVFGTLSGLLATGWSQQVWNNPDISYFSKLTEILGNANTYVALLSASFAGLIAAIVLTVSQRIFDIRKSIEHVIEGFATMLPAILILILAWSLASMTGEMHTADFLSQVLVDLKLSAYVLPAVTFILAAVIAFSTGSSWGTMAILYPLILPVSWMVSQEHGLDYNASLAIFNNVVSSILAGAVFGDHCSPISDTTVLSSLASSCNHIEHVRTQLPYAITVGIVGTLFGTLPAAYGVPFYVLFPLNILILYLIIRFVGRKTDIGISSK